MTGAWNEPEKSRGDADAATSPFAPPSAYRAAPRTEPGSGAHGGASPGPYAPVPPPPPSHQQRPAPEQGDPWAVLGGVGQQQVPAPARSVDPSLVAVPAGMPGAPGRSRSRRGVRPGAVAGVAVLALVAGAAGGVVADRLTDAQGGTTASGIPAATVHQQSQRPEGSVADIAGTVLPSVVSLQVTGSEGVVTGSGFVLRDDGYILTNNHVVAAGGDGGDIVVLFSDGHESDAELVGRTGDYDLAVVKVPDKGLTPLELGDSDAVVVGDPVVAVGAPLGLNGTVTTGIVSALNRPVQAGEGASQTAFINAIQTDAAINPGNSGGPLVNGSGQVVGINSAIAQPPGAAQATGSIGLGFAIPSNQARRTADQLISDGVATYPVIGVLLDPAYTGEGVEVTTQAQQGQPAVTPDGPADDAGIREGDVILSIDGRPVTQSDELIVAIRALAPGDAVTLRVRSGEQERDVRVVLDAAKSE